MRKGYRGQSRLFRFADDFVCCFDYRHEAEALEVALAERMQKFRLELRRSLTWSAFNRLLKRFRVPPSRVVEATTRVRRLPGLPEWSLKQTSQVKLFGEHYRAARA